MPPNIKKHYFASILHSKILPNFMFTECENQANVLFLEVLSPHVISWTCLVSTPPLISMSVNFICILLTSSSMHEVKRSTISYSPRQQGVVRSPLTEDSPFTILASGWEDTCRLESKRSGCFWARFSTCVDHDLPLASYRWFKRGDWATGETPGRRC